MHTDSSDYATPVYPEKRLTMSEIFCPPKPKLLLRAWDSPLFAGRVGDVIEVAFGIGRLVIDGRRQHAAAHAPRRR